jgi:hypothetical protein
MPAFFVPVLFTFYIQGVLKFKCKTPVPKVKMNRTGNVRVHVTLRRVLAAIVAVEKQ